MRFYAVVALLVWTICATAGYLRSDDTQFRCYDGDAGFLSRVVYGYTKGIREPPKDLGDALKEMGGHGVEFGAMVQESHEVRTIFKEVNWKNIATIILGMGSMYDLGTAIKFAQVATSCAPPLFSPTFPGPSITRFRSLTP